MDFKAMRKLSNVFVRTVLFASPYSISNPNSPHSNPLILHRPSFPPFVFLSPLSFFLYAVLRVRAGV
jgi:hypothetical protein